MLSWWVEGLGWMWPFSKQWVTHSLYNDWELSFPHRTWVKTLFVCVSFISAGKNCDPLWVNNYNVELLTMDRVHALLDRVSSRCVMYSIKCVSGSNVIPFADNKSCWSHTEELSIPLSLHLCSGPSLSEHPIPEPNSKPYQQDPTWGSEPATVPPPPLSHRPQLPAVGLLMQARHLPISNRNNNHSSLWWEGSMSKISWLIVWQRGSEVNIKLEEAGKFT